MNGNNKISFFPLIESTLQQDTSQSIASEQDLRARQRAVRRNSLPTHNHTPTLHPRAKYLLPTQTRLASTNL